MNIEQIMSEEVRAGGKLCSYLTKVGFYITFDSVVGQWVLFEHDANQLPCNHPFMNYNACMMLTQQNTCIWDAINFFCDEISRNELDLSSACDNLNSFACVSMGLK